VDRVRVVYRKFDGSLHWNQYAQLLGDDEHGVWVGAPADTVVWKGEVEWGPCESPFVALLPRDGWWTATFNAVPHRTEVYCDISTVPTWPSPHEVTMVDLDLDVRRRRTGETELLDEDEFAEHRLRFGYPEDVVTAAEAAARWLFTAVRDRVEPFGAAYLPWLARVSG
jgi:protein associated with RNAse G/E